MINYNSLIINSQRQFLNGGRGVQRIKCPMSRVSKNIPHKLVEKYDLSEGMHNP